MFKDFWSGQKSLASSPCSSQLNITMGPGKNIKRKSKENTERPWGSKMILRQYLRTAGSWQPRPNLPSSNRRSSSSGRLTSLLGSMGFLLTIIPGKFGRTSLAESIRFPVHHKCEYSKWTSSVDFFKRIILNYLSGNYISTGQVTEVWLISLLRWCQVSLNHDPCELALGSAHLGLQSL